MRLTSHLVRLAAQRLFPLRTLKARVAGDRGSALVEMAVSLPIMMIMLTGIFSFSTALYQKLQLAEAVSNGGRILATERGDTDPCQKTTSAILSAAPGLKQSDIRLTYTLGGQSYGSGVNSCPGASGAANANMTAGGTASIQASYPCTLSVYGMKMMSCSIGEQITEAVQ